MGKLKTVQNGKGSKPRPVKDLNEFNSNWDQIFSKKTLDKSKKNSDNTKTMRNEVPTVHELRKSGYKVKVGHHRLFYKYNPKTGKRSEKVLLFKDQKETFSDYYLDANGGFTMVTIKAPNNPNEVVGVSKCSKKELYCKKYGTMKAIARALSKAK